MNFSCTQEDLSRNSVTTEYWKQPEDREDIALATGIVLTIFLVLGIPWNLFVIVGTLYKRLYKQPTHILLLSLAFSNLLLCVLVMPFGIVTGFAREFVFGNSDYIRCQFCQLNGLLLIFFVESSFHILTLVSLDRFIYIKMAIKYYKIVTIKRVCVVIGSVWLLCLLLATPPLYQFGEIKFIFFCTIKLKGETQLTKNINYGILAGVESILPVSILVVTNVWVAVIAFKQLSKTKTPTVGSTSPKMNASSKYDKIVAKKQRKLVYLFGVTLLAYFITYIPTISILLATISGSTLHTCAFAVIYLCLFLHSILHPIIETGLQRDLYTLLKCNFQVVSACSKVGYVINITLQ